METNVDEAAKRWACLVLELGAQAHKEGLRFQNFHQSKYVHSTKPFASIHCCSIQFDFDMSNYKG